MSIAASPSEEKLMTVEEFLALPEDGQDRWLIRGQVYPREPSMSVRNRKHSKVEANLVQLLKNWLDRQPEPRGEIHSGDAGFRLRGTSDSLVGADVAYASADLVSGTNEELPYHDGPPVLAVEILSPSDKHEELVRKVLAYLEAGAVVWEVDPDFRTVCVHRPGREPETFNALQELSGETDLPGFRVNVAEIFQ